MSDGSQRGGLVWAGQIPAKSVSSASGSFSCVHHTWIPCELDPRLQFRAHRSDPPNWFVLHLCLSVHENKWNSQLLDNLKKNTEFSCKNPAFRIHFKVRQLWTCLLVAWVATDLFGQKTSSPAWPSPRTLSYVTHSALFLLTFPPWLCGLPL